MHPKYEKKRIFQNILNEDLWRIESALCELQCLVALNDMHPISNPCRLAAFVCQSVRVREINL
jgi:hypothetical protein